MEGISQTASNIAPVPTTAFEAFVINALQALSKQITDSTNDLAESIAHVANVTVTKEEFNERIEPIEKRLDTIESQMATKQDLKKEIGATEYRIKAYIDDKVVTQNIIPIIQKEDKKINKVVDSLTEKSVFSSTDADYLKKQGPFPQLV